ncbi:unnamed protein product [Lupinus luteus]|uniref:Uncharacterized protein n=1 Tax=Lupinus luteus TaxID=3873 RepID=A0AAV1WN32_LUPLU
MSEAHKALTEMHRTTHRTNLTKAYKHLMGQTRTTHQAQLMTETTKLCAWCVTKAHTKARLMRMMIEACITWPRPI